MHPSRYALINHLYLIQVCKNAHFYKSIGAYKPPQPFIAAAHPTQLNTIIAALEIMQHVGCLWHRCATVCLLFWGSFSQGHRLLFLPAYVVVILKEPHNLGLLMLISCVSHFAGKWIHCLPAREVLGKTDRLELYHHHHHGPQRHWQSRLMHIMSAICPINQS